MRRRTVGLVTAVVVVIGVIAFAGVRAIHAEGASAKPVAAVAKPAAIAKAQPAASVKGARSAMYSLTAGGRKRSYEVFTPITALPKSAPIIVMLAGINSTLPDEVSRDRLVNYAIAGKAEVIYPVPVDESWNAIGCCGKAALDNVNDLAFMKALVGKADPGRARPIYVVGYSNGARLAYRVACDDPTLFDGYASVKGEPTAGCVIRKPVNILQIASVDDPEVPYQPGDKGSVESLPVTTLVAQLHAADKCPAGSTKFHSGEMTQTTWSGCADGTRLSLAAWSKGVHSFPRPPGTEPAAAQVIWAFFTKTRFASLPA